MAEHGTSQRESFRAKHAGMPGSIVAIRLDYARRKAAFDSHPVESQMGKMRNDVTRWKQGQRLGDKAEWNGQTRDEKRDAFPTRALMHQLNEFQSIRPSISFRSQKLPTINKDSIFIPRSSKMQINQSIFLSESERKKVVHTCPATVSSTVLKECDDTPEKQIGGPWNNSIALDPLRADLFKRPKIERFTDINKVKNIIDPMKYKSPQQLEAIRSKHLREQKLAEREQLRLQKERDSRERKILEAKFGHGKTFKMSNRDQWEADDPTAELRTQFIESLKPKPPAEAAARIGGRHGAASGEHQQGDDESPRQ